MTRKEFDELYAQGAGGLVGYDGLTPRLQALYRELCCIDWGHSEQITTFAFFSTADKENEWKRHLLKLFEKKKIKLEKLL